MARFRQAIIASGKFSSSDGSGMHGGNERGIEFGLDIDRRAGDPGSPADPIGEPYFAFAGMRFGVKARNRRLPFGKRFKYYL